MLILRSCLALVARVNRRTLRVTAVSKREQPRVRSLITVGGWPRVSTYGGQRDPIPQNSGVRERVKVDGRTRRCFAFLRTGNSSGLEVSCRRHFSCRKNIWPYMIWNTAQNTARSCAPCQERNTAGTLIVSDAFQPGAVSLEVITWKSLCTAQWRLLE